MKHAICLFTIVLALNSVFAQEMSEAEKEKARFNVAVDLQQNYQREGLDIEVLSMDSIHNTAWP